MKLKKGFALFSIIILLLTQAVPLSVLGNEVPINDNLALNIQVNEDMTNEKAVVTIEATEPLLDSIEVKLPTSSTYSDHLTNDLQQEGVNIQYDETNHLLILNWEEAIAEQKAEFILTDIQEIENYLFVSGIIDNAVVINSEYSFILTSVSKEEQYSTTQQEPTLNQPEEESIESATIEEDAINESQAEFVEEKSESLDVPLQETNISAGNLASLEGNLNVNIDISPYTATVESGKQGMYKLVLKTTGSTTTYKNAKVIVDLPITDYTSFTQNVSELTINGVTPTYNETTHQLIYEFDELKSGSTYETIVKVDTENGFSLNDAQLTAQASFEADNQPKITDSAIITIKASNAVSISKKFVEARYGGEVQKAPFPGSYTVWDIAASIPKKEIGQMYLKEGTKIVIKDTFDSNLTFYDVMGTTPQPKSTVGNTLTWEFDVPTLEEQENMVGDFFTINLRVRLQVKNDANLVGKSVSNGAEIVATFIDEKETTGKNTASVGVTSKEQATDTIEGLIVYPVHLGPTNGNGGLANNELKDPNPIVYDDAYLRFRHGLTSMHPGVAYDMRAYTSIYEIDPNLILDKLVVPGNWKYGRTNAEIALDIPLAKDPIFNIVATVNGQERVLVENAESGKTYTRSELGLSPSDEVSRIKYDFTYAPAGMFPNTRADYYFYVKPGYVGQVENTFNVHIVDYQDNIFWYKRDRADTHFQLASPRHATIAPRPTDSSPIGQVAIELLNHEGGEITTGNNRMKVTLTNTNSSLITMSGPLETVVLLPAGVTLNPSPNATYTGNDGKVSNGNYEILSDDYNGSGRQLVKIKWDDDRIRIGKNLTAELDIVIPDGVANSLQFDVYGFSSDQTLGAPATSGNSITDTILQTDDDDLNGNGISDQPRLKSGNIYTLRGAYDLQTEKLVKGELDSEFTHFGHTKPSGLIEYQLKLTNTSGKNISSMTLIDVLPSVGDLGITDNIERGSQFTPTMTNSIVLPAEWQEKVNVYYSTAKNPKRDELTSNTIYPETATPLTNPSGVEDPNWMTEAEVTDWSQIHSFKIELKEGVTWIQGQNMMIQFGMQAPSEFEVAKEVLDPSVAPTERAAWNSFAVATDHGQPVEPLRVGVYMDYEIEEPTIEKDVNGQKETWQLQNREEQFTWSVVNNFGNYTANWESVQVSDTLHPLLEVVKMEVIDQFGNDVSTNGTLNHNPETNVVTFDLAKQNDSFAYLNGQIYTLKITTKIKDSATDAELLPFIQGTGIPNEATLVVDNDPKKSNIVTVKPPVDGGIEITKVDKETKAVLERAAFELRDSDGKVVSSGITDSNGKLQFANLPLGSYQLVETKAPEGYKILTKPLDVQITTDYLKVSLEVENSKTGWELPQTGGIGTILFYSLGALLMGAAFVLYKRKKTSR